MRYTATVLIATVSALVLACDGKRSGLTEPGKSSMAISPSGQSVSSFTLINADTDKPVAGHDPMQSGAVVDIAAIGTRNLSIRANTEPGTVGSVKFGYDASASYRLEGKAPYSIAGDEIINGTPNYVAWVPTLGSHTVSATPYTAAGATGTAGAKLTLAFSVVSAATAAPPTTAPVASVKVTPATASVAVASGTQLTALTADSAGTTLTGPVVAWTTSNPAVATVSAAGLVAGVAAGTATITATSNGKLGTSAVTVTAAPATGGACGLVTDTEQKTVPVIAKPGYLQSIIDPTFKTKVTRITGDPGTSIAGVGGSWGDVARHNYSKDAAWNSDQSLIVLKQAPGAGGLLFLDGTTYAPRFTRASSPGETRWHPQQPNVMLYINSSCEIGAWDVRANTRTTLLRPAGYTGCAFGPYEGNASQDGSKAAALATRSSDGRQVAFAIDLAARTKLADIDMAANGITSVDWVSISALGRHVVVNGSISGATTSGGAYDATRVFNLGGTPVGPVWTEYGIPSHYDLSVDLAGNEVAVGVAKTGPAGIQGRVVMRRLTDGTITVLNSGGYAMHTSTRNTERAGRAYVTHGYNSSWPPFRSEIFSVKLDGSRAIERLVHHRSRNTDYNAEPHGVVSPDGKRVLFASNWESTSGRPIQAYVVDVRDICP